MRAAVSLEIPPVLESAATLDGACSAAEYTDAAIGPAIATMNGAATRWPMSEVVFTPNRDGPHDATLTLWTPADNSPHTIRLRGWGLCPQHCP